MSKILLVGLLLVASMQVVAMSNVTWLSCRIERGGFGHSNNKGDASILFKIEKCDTNDTPKVYEHKWAKLSPAQSILGVDTLLLALAGNGKVRLGVLNTSKMDKVLLIDGLYIDRGINHIIANGQPVASATASSPTIDTHYNASGSTTTTTATTENKTSHAVAVCNKTAGYKFAGGKCLAGCSKILHGTCDPKFPLVCDNKYTQANGGKTWDCGGVCCLTVRNTATNDTGFNGGLGSQ